MNDEARIKYEEREYHNKIAEKYNSIYGLHTPFKELSRRKTVKELLGIIQKESIVLDLGCGTGYIFIPMLKRGLRVVAADISFKMIEEAKIRSSGKSNVNFVVCDAEYLPFNEETFDLVHCRATLHHIPEPAKAILEISRVIKKGGHLVIPASMSQIKFERNPFALPFGGHLREYTPASLEKLVKTNFDIIVEESFQSTHGGHHPFLRLYSKLLERLKYKFRLSMGVIQGFLKRLVYQPLPVESGLIIGKKVKRSTDN